MNIPLRALVVAVLLVCVSSGAGAATKTYQIAGKVISRSEVLAAYGVQPGTNVDVTYTVELTTPIYAQVGPPDNQTTYVGAITFMLIQIGTWSALNLVPPAGSVRQDFVSIANDSGSPAKLDLLHVTTPGQDNDHVLYGVAGPLMLGMQLNDIKGKAAIDQGIDQDPTKFPNGVGFAMGAGGSVTFQLGGQSSGGGGGGGKDPLADCHKSQLSAGAKLCQSQLKCQATFAKDPSKTGAEAKLDSCLDKAGDSFERAYDKAAQTALKKGRLCASDASASDQRAEITGNVDDVVEVVSAVNPTHAPLESSWLGAAGTACGAALRAEAANAGKPNAEKLAKARGKASDKLDGAAAKAVEKAVKKHVVFDPAPDVQGLVDSTNAAIDAIEGVLSGQN